MEVTKVYSVSGLLPSDTPIISQRPFRAPHYTISHAGLVGGGRWPRPGEISLSHRGVLFLDEFLEFGHAVLEVLRQPLEDKVVTISRAQGSITFPANFMLVSAMNPCPCGYYGDPVKECRCTPGEISREDKRISGPLLDRIDIYVDVPRVEYERLADDRLGEASEKVRARVEAARQNPAGTLPGYKHYLQRGDDPGGGAGVLPGRAFSSEPAPDSALRRRIHFCGTHSRCTCDSWDESVSHKYHIWDGPREDIVLRTVRRKCNVSFF